MFTRFIFELVFPNVGKVKFSLYRPWRPLVLREAEVPTFSRHSAHR
jgi:hypothetical protein